MFTYVFYVYFMQATRGEHYSHFFLNVTLFCIPILDCNKFFLIYKVLFYLIQFIEVNGGLLLENIHMVVVTYFIWISWKMKNYFRFQNSIDLEFAVKTIS